MNNYCIDCHYLIKQAPSFEKVNPYEEIEIALSQRKDYKKSK